METVEVVIRIPTELKAMIDAECVISLNTTHDKMINAIKNGTVLPKGHGRLIDADAATKDINTFQDVFAMYTDNMGKYNIVCAAPTVIEADRGDDNG